MQGERGKQGSRGVKPLCPLLSAPVCCCHWLPPALPIACVRALSPPLPPAVPEDRSGERAVQPFCLLSSPFLYPVPLSSERAVKPFYLSPLCPCLLLPLIFCLLLCRSACPPPALSPVSHDLWRIIFPGPLAIRGEGASGRRGREGGRRRMRVGGEGSRGQRERERGPCGPPQRDSWVCAQAVAGGAPVAAADHRPPVEAALPARRPALGPSLGGRNSPSARFLSF